MSTDSIDLNTLAPANALPGSALLIGVTRQGPGAALAAFPASALFAETASYATAAQTALNGAVAARAAATERWRGPWTATTAYAALDIVSHAGASWVATAAVAAGQASPSEAGSAAVWALLAARGAPGPQGAAGVVSAAGDGAVAAPGVAFAAALGSGMWRATAGDVVFSRNGVEALRLGADAVGIGTSTPAARLDVAANSAAPALRVTQTGAGHALVIQDSGGSDSTPVVVDSDGRVGIGSGAPGTWYNLSTSLLVNRTQDGDTILGIGNAFVGGSARMSIRMIGGTAHNFVSYTLTENGGNPFSEQLFGNSVRHHRFVFGTSERMRITSAGQLAIGTTAPNASAQLDVNSTSRGFLPPRMTAAQRDDIDAPANGLILYNTTTNKLQVRAAGVWVDLH